MTGPAPCPDLSRLDRAAHQTWLLFADWCSACDLRALPATPETVAEFLADHPAQVSTHRRRVAAINSVHRQCGLAEPGRAHAVHSALSSRRAHRLRILVDVARERIAQLPTTGWPHGMFGRRDAMILTLVAAGLTYTEIGALRRGELRRDGDALAIESRRQWRLAAVAADQAHSPAAVYDRWARVQALLDSFPSTRMLAHYFDHSPALLAQGAPPMLADKHAGQPVITSIDRWGYPPLVPTPMTEQSIAAITRAHLEGRAPSHHLPSRPRPVEDTAQSSSDRANPAAPVLLDNRYHYRGIEARRRAHAELSALDDWLDGVNARADQLLEELARVVSEPVDDAP
jgi:hypothetical protein